MSWLVLVVGVPVVGWVVGRRWWRTLDFIDRPVVRGLWWTLSPVAGLVLGLLASVCTTGALPGYGEGVVEGDIAGLSVEGVFWKTCEGKLLLDSGERSGRQIPWAFSVPVDNKPLWDKAHEKMGRRVRVTYRQWLIMPCSIGDADVQVTGIDSVDPGP
jgi:hypothetical protein